MTIIYGLLFYYGMAYKYKKTYNITFKQAKEEVKDLLRTYYQQGKYKHELWQQGNDKHE